MMIMSMNNINNNDDNDNDNANNDDNNDNNNATQKDHHLNECLQSSLVCPHVIVFCHLSS